jgi:hypothetical protein
MSDTPETDAKAIHDGEVVPVGFARKLERERDEERAEFARHREELEKTRTELELWRDGNIVREEDKVEREQWRECAEKLARLLRQRIDHDDDVFLDWESDALVAFDRLKEASK